MKKHKAAISIFLVIITVASVMLGGLYIDMTRILVAKNKVRTATESAVRSTLAGYSDDLVSDWGLFGLLEEDAEDDFKKYLKLNLSTGNTESKANIINYEIIDDETTINLSRPLSDSDVFSEKITEYEKYRAPVSLTLGTISKFKAIFGNNNETAQVNDVDVSGIISSATNKMKDKFSDIKNTIKNNFSSLIGSDLKTDTSTSSNGTMNTIDSSKLENLRNSISNEISQYNGVLDEYQNSLEEYEAKGDSIDEISDSISQNVDTSEANGDIMEDDEIYIDETNTYENKPDTSGDGFDNDINEETSKLAETKGQIDDAKDSVESLKNKLNTLINTAEENLNNYNRYANEYNIKYNSLSTAASNQGIDISTIISSYTTDTVEGTEAKINEVESYVNEKESELILLQAKVSTTNYTTAESKYNAMNDEYNNAKNIDNSYSNEEDKFNAISYTTYPYFYNYYITNAANYDKFSNLLNGFYNDSVSPAKTEYDNLYSNYNKDNNKLIQIIEEVNGTAFKTKKFAVANKNDIINMVKAKINAKESYEQYENILNQIAEINAQEEIGIVDANGNDIIIDFGSKAEEEMKSKYSFSDISKVVDNVKEKINELQKTIPTDNSSEYNLNDDSGIIKMFSELKNYFVGLGNLVTNADAMMDKVYLVDYVMSKCTFLTSQTSRKHYFSAGEVEYIIFGNESQTVNIISAVGSIAFMRLAINTINYWLTSANAELVSRTVTAVLRGITQTVNDMTTMLLDTGTGSDKGLIAICPSLKNYKVLSYSDHLRILLLLKMSDDGGAGALRRCIHATMKEEYDEDIADISTSSPLGEYYTQATATTSVDVDLFFIPMFIPESVNVGPIHDGKFKVTSSISFGY